MSAGTRARSEELFARGKRRIPGGVNSPVRAFRGVGGAPVFFARAAGAWLWDVDGNEYVDYINSWGPTIVGHAHPEVLAAISEAAARGTTFGAPTEAEVLFAEEICAAVPSIEVVRLVSSGTEATMSALRVARGATGRSKIIKIDGAYHGHADFLLASAGSGVATLGLPGTAGVTAPTVADTLTVPWNDAGAIAAIFDELRARPTAERVAAVIIEPVCGNMGTVAPKPGYLEALRKLCSDDGAILIFDEVMTGFRLAYGGAQERFSVKPDMTTLGKVVGGGLPLAAYGGREDIMRNVAPDGPVYQAGTLSGNPVAVAAGRKTLEILRRPGTYEALEKRSTAIVSGLAALTREAGIPVTWNQVGSMFTGFFTDGEVFDYTSAKRSDTARFARFFHAMLDGGVYLPPSQFEAAFVSLAHDDRTLERTLESARAALKTLSIR
jgi:glutamate-1-semialdehyde 2,1-aminomutase